MSLAVARALLEIGAVGFSPQKPITFKSGIVSPVYVDNRRLPYHPAQWRIVIEAFQALIEAENISFDAIAGVAVGGVPHSAALGFAMQRPSLFVRKEAKEYGKAQRVEGGEVIGKTILLVEDLITTGASSISGVEALRAEGAIVNEVIGIVSYGFEEATKNFQAAHLRLHTLTNFHVIMEAALQMAIFAEGEAAIIADWFNEPHGWAARHL